jgi:ubiquinol-cytochrome c reductase cytochrome b subunit
VSIGTWLRERLTSARTSGLAPLNPSHIPAPSFAYVAGWVLVMILVIEAVTGAALAAFYAPTTTDAWASVAYIQDQMNAGWLIRGLHHHGASALVIVAGIHLAHTAIRGAYRKPREIVWWLGLVLFLLVLAFAITGYVLRWDQSGYWANQVEVGIAAGTPIVGGAIKQLMIGGNEYGNLTLTRFYALHVAVLPGIVMLYVLVHVVLSRRHGVATPTERTGAGISRWPQQTFRTALACAVAFAALLAYVVSVHGADLAAPADPSAAFDARPLWYFRWLFALRKLAGSAEQLVAMAVPAIVIGGLAMLPFIDATRDGNAPRSIFVRRLVAGVVGGLFALIAALTVMSYVSDAGDSALAKRVEESNVLATRMRALAAKNGVPATGPQHLLETQPMYRGRALFAQYCASCHDDKSKDRVGPIIAVGHGSRAWLRGMLVTPSGDPFWGKTKLAKAEEAMKPVDLAPAQLDELVEALYAEGGAADVDTAKRDRGRTIFNDACNDCHSLEEGMGGGGGPGLGTLKSRGWYVSFIGNPKSALHMGPDKSEMPRFDKDLSFADRDLIAEYLVWLKSATPAQLSALGPL